jgi:hypothetical protein
VEPLLGHQRALQYDSQATGLAHKHVTLAGVACSDKRPSLLYRSNNYGGKKFCKRDVPGDEEEKAEK